MEGDNYACAKDQPWLGEWFLREGLFEKNHGIQADDLCSVQDSFLWRSLDSSSFTDQSPVFYLLSIQSSTSGSLLTSRMTPDT